MSIMYVNSVGECASRLVLSVERDGDHLCTIVQEGWTEDAWPLLAGYLDVANVESGQRTRHGMLWDEQRIIVFLSLDVPECGYHALEMSGFSIP